MEDIMKERILTLDGVVLIVGFALLVILGVVQTLNTPLVVN